MFDSFRRYIYICTAMVCISALAGCVKNPEFKTRTLPSGRAVKVLGISQTYFSQGDSALTFDYETDLNMSDKDALRAEVDDIWSEFRNEAESSNFKIAIVHAHKFPHGFVFSKTQFDSHEFVYQKGLDGKWLCLEDMRPMVRPTT